MNWPVVWKSVFTINKSSESLDNDYRIVHNIIWTNEKLHNIGKINNPHCKFCDKDSIENLEHMILDCKSVKNLHELILDFIEVFFQSSGFGIDDFHQWLLFGYPVLNEANNLFLIFIFSFARLAIIKRRVLFLNEATRVDLCILFKTLLTKHMNYLYQYMSTHGNRHIYLLLFSMNSYIEINDRVHVKFN
ncbi:hypothetical protein SNE40_022368 [Patella caerulea]|uniref:Reverse transcriptase zinc-binding domain-containing protein n=1 Tax=Patella caerulea TaxID=87958 RepID=A0AAN8G7X5_PATCE